MAEEKSNQQNWGFFEATVKIGFGISNHHFDSLTDSSFISLIAVTSPFYDKQ